MDNIIGGNLKAFVSVDLEGMPHVASPAHLSLGKPLYAEARKIATRVTRVVVEELHQEGFDEIVVADSHGPMVNLLVEELPGYVEVVRGFPRPLSMVVGVEGADAALFLGYHAKAGTAYSSFDHTYSGSVSKVLVNGVEASEYLLNAYVAGHYGVPVVLVAGDEKLMEDVEKHTPWASRIVLKKAPSRYSSISESVDKLEEHLRLAVKEAAASLRTGRAKPLRLDGPVRMRVCFINSGYADVAELSPLCRRVSGTCVEYEVDSIVDAYRQFELLVLAGASLARIFG